MLRTFLIAFLVFQVGLLSANKMTNEQYIAKYKLLALQEMFEYKIPASITLAQGILESGSGNSKLATKGNNHFGIKCHSDWKGKKIYHDDDEKHECFRKYDRVEDSYVDHSLFLVKKKRYEKLFKLKITDYKGWAKELKAAGYATNPKYPKRLIDIIERYNLDKFDKLSENEFELMVMAANADPNNSVIIPKKSDKYKPPPAAPSVVTKPQIRGGYHEVMYHNRIKYIIARKGDTPEKIADEFNMWVSQIYKFNDLPRSAKLVEGMVVYLQPKRRKGVEKYYKVKKGDSMWDISQQQGIKLSWLYKRNHMKEGTEPRMNQKMWIRKTKPLEEKRSIF